VRTLVITLAAVLLSGCQTKFVTRSCLTPQQYAELKSQEPPKVTGSLTGKADEDVRVIAGSALRLRGWGHNMLDVLKICAG
jgi:uncharacterized lipoprotein YajG